MRFDHSKYFHQLTTDRSDGGWVSIPDDPDKWPVEWREVYCKQYSFFKELSLPPAQGYFFEELAVRRNSRSKQLGSNNVSLGDVAYLLKCGYGLQSDFSNSTSSLSHRTVPSAGARYPLEMYVLLFEPQQELLPGIYHYNVRSHALEIVQQRTFSETDKSALSPLPWFADTHGMFCISAVFQRTIGKYGVRGYRYILLEAGHVAQNLQLAATERGLVLVPTGGVEDCLLEQLIGLDDSRERLVYSLCF